MSITVPLYGFGGGGGTSLNFDVKAYPSDADMMTATPKENTIGIITVLPISGWIFSVTAPEEPTEGMAWVITGTARQNEFNALKKNGIHVYPVSAKQYVSGAWVDVIAKRWQGEVWVDLIYYIVNGNTSKITNITGFASAQWSISDNGLRITRNSSGSQSSLGITKDAFDFSGKDKLVIELASTNKELWVSPCNTKGDSRIATLKMKTSGKYELDISAINQMCRLWFDLEQGNDSTISKMWLE